jgi:hypothetical protein
MKNAKKIKKCLASAMRVFFAFILIVGLMPALPQQAHAEQQTQEAQVEAQAQTEQEAQAEFQTQAEQEEQANLLPQTNQQTDQQTQENTYSAEEYSAEAYTGYRVWLYGYGSSVTVDIYKYNVDTDAFDLQSSDVDPSRNAIWGLPGTKYRVDYNIPENTKPESKITMRDGVTCEAVEGKEYAWILTFPDTAPNDYSESNISVKAYTQSSVTCEEVENGSIAYQFIEGDGYEGTIQVTFTPNSGYAFEKAEYKYSYEGYSGSYVEISADAQEDGSYIATYKIEKSTNAYAYSFKASFVKTEKLDIASEEDLLDFAARVKKGESFAGSTITLKNDITLSSDWTTIGNTVFRGTFDGDGHTISGFNVQGFVKISTGYQCGGLFYSTKYATIKNLTLEGNTTITDISSYYYQLGMFSCLAANSTFEKCTNKVNITFAKGQNIGGIVGWVQGNCKFTNCSNEGVISCTDEGNNTGGIVGYVSRDYNSDKYTVFTKCANYADIRYDSEGATSENATGYNLGGIVGSLYNGQFENCLNKGNIVAIYRGAGICGYLSSSSGSGPFSFSNCYNTGNVTVSSPASKKSGQPVAAGICAMDPDATSIKASFTSCYNTGTITRSGSMADANPNTCIGQIAPDILITGTDYAAGDNYNMTDNDNWEMDKCYGSDDTFTASDLGDAYRDEAAGVTGGSPLLTWEPEDATNSKARIAATSVTLDATALSLEQYDTYTLNATVEPTSTTDKIEWTSSNEKVATVTSSASANTKGVITCVGAGECVITATAGDVSATCTLNVSAYDGTLLQSDTTIEDGQTYKIIPGTEGTFEIPEGASVTIKGAGTSSAASLSNVHFLLNDSSKLTLKDIYIKERTSPIVEMATDASAELDIEGTVLLEYEFQKYETSTAAIHVAPSNSLTIGGAGTFYLYKSTGGAGIGGTYGLTDAGGKTVGEVNGNITFAMTGTMFAKGTKQGALIGAGAESKSGGTPGTISFVSGTYNLIANSRGAAIGGGAGSDGASSGADVYVSGETTSININVDYSGAAIGGAGYADGNDSGGGTFTVSGGSVRTFIDNNAVFPSGGTDPSGSLWNGVTDMGVNSACITGTKTNANGEAVYLLELDTSLLENKPEDGIYDVDIDGIDFYCGGLHKYSFINETATKTEQADISDTLSNWCENEDSCLYFYVTGTDHDITINNQSFTATWDGEAAQTSAKNTGGCFTVEEVKVAPHTTGDINNNGKINIVDAQLCYDLACGNYKSGDDPYGAFPLPDGWNTETLVAAVDVNEDGALDSSDAFAIQYYVHYGVFGAKTAD